VNELFSDPNSAGRPLNSILYMFGEGHGIVNSNGQTWENNRRFTIRKLRDVDVFKSSIESLIIDEASTLISFFERSKGKTISSRQVFNAPVVNSLWRIVSGERDSAEILKRAEGVIR